MTTIAIVGSRAYANGDRIRATVRTLPPDTVIVSGGAVGADSIAADEARLCGLQVIEYLADWKRYGKAAGMRRNGNIVNAADELIAFWDGVSGGTKDSIDKARKRRIRVTVVDTDGGVTVYESAQASTQMEMF